MAQVALEITRKHLSWNRERPLAQRLGGLGVSVECWSLEAGRWPLGRWPLGRWPLISGNLSGLDLLEQFGVGFTRSAGVRWRRLDSRASQLSSPHSADCKASLNYATIIRAYGGGWSRISRSSRCDWARSQAVTFLEREYFVSLRSQSRALHAASEHA
jgi:hypothetical protein